MAKKQKQNKIGSKRFQSTLTHFPLLGKFIIKFNRFECSENPNPAIDLKLDFITCDDDILVTADLILCEGGSFRGSSFF